jgi:MFS family permease
LDFSTDAKLFIFAKGFRSFGYGFISIVVVVYLQALGFGTLAIGILLSLGSVGSAFANVLVSGLGDRVGRRRTLIILSAILFAASVVILTTANFLILALTFFIGTTATTGTGNGPTEAIEQASMPDTTSAGNRNYLFSFYNITGSIMTALGALFAGLQSTFKTSLSLDNLSSLRAYFLVYAAIGLIVLVFYARLSPKVEVSKPTSEHREESISTAAERRAGYSIIAKLSGLFALDSFGALFTNQPIVTLWLTARFGTGLQNLGSLFFFTTIFGAMSYLMSARIANRIGRVRTMVVTQIPSNILLILAAFSPTYSLAIGFYVARSFMYQMDVPARQAYIVSVVQPALRTPASGITNLSRSAGQALSPSVAAYLIQQTIYSGPLFLAGSVKLLYVLLLYVGFRHHE